MTIVTLSKGGSKRDIGGGGCSITLNCLATSKGNLGDRYCSKVGSEFFQIESYFMPKPLHRGINTRMVVEKL